MISRFCRYVDKVFDFADQLRSLKDSRRSPQIPTAAVWASAWAMFVIGRKTLNAIEGDLRVPQRLDGLIGPRKPSADTIGRVLGRMDSEPLRQMLSHINHQLGRNKALPLRWPIRVVAVDGHEFFSQSIAVLPGVQLSDGDGEGGAGRRVLSPGRGGPPDRLSSGPTPRCGTARTRRG